MTQKALIYCRVSTKRQSSHGSGLSSQQKRCEIHAVQHGYEVENVFPDDISGGGSFMHRKGMVDMLKHIKANPNERYVVIFDDLKRLSRNTQDYLSLREKLDGMRVRVECLNFNFDDTPEGEFYETIVAAGGHLERRQLARQTYQKVNARFEAGFWGYRAPVGFKLQTEKNKARILERDEPIATFVQNALEGYASGHYQTQMEVKRYLETCPEFPKTYNKGREIHPDRIRRILTSIVYAGMVEIPERGISRRNGQHEGLISLATFYKIQERLHGKKKHAATRTDLNADFILRGAVNCADCDKPLTANWSKGRNTRYPYYLCRTKGCPSNAKSIRREKLESEFEALLKTLVPTKELGNVAEIILRDLWDDIQSNKDKYKKQLSEELGQLESFQQKTIDKLVDTYLPQAIAAYEQKIEKIEAQKVEIEDKINRFDEPILDFDKSFRTGLEFLKKPWFFWASREVSYKRAVLKLAFSDSLRYDRKTGFRTAAISVPFKALKEFDSHDSKMAEREGFEPSLGLTLNTLSRRAPSATQPPLLNFIPYFKALTVSLSVR